MLEFLNLKDEYSESDLEAALIAHLEGFLMELGGDFTFVGRQRRLRIDDEWYRIDLLFLHRRLRSLVIIDLKRESSHTPTPGRCTGISTTLASTEWLNAAAPGIDSQWELTLYGLVRTGEREKAIQFLKESRHLSRQAASRKVSAIAAELGIR